LAIKLLSKFAPPLCFIEADERLGNEELLVS